MAYQQQLVQLGCCLMCIVGLVLSSQLFISQGLPRWGKPCGLNWQGSQGATQDWGTGAAHLVVVNAAEHGSLMMPSIFTPAKSPSGGKWLISPTEFFFSLFVYLVCWLFARVCRKTCIERMHVQINSLHKGAFFIIVLRSFWWRHIFRCFILLWPAQWETNKCGLGWKIRFRTKSTMSI